MKIRHLAAISAALLGISVSAQEYALSDSYNSDAHFRSLYENAEMKYSISNKDNFTNFAEWQTLFRQELKKTLGITAMEKQLMGFKPTARQIDSEDLGYAVRERWEIWTEPDIPLPVIIMKPKNIKGKLPLMVTPHGHGKNTEAYAGVYWNEEDREEGEEGERNVAVQAVQHGFISIAPTSRAFGKTRTNEGIANDDYCSCHTHMLRDLIAGRTAIGDRVWDMMRIIDWALENLPVDRQKICISGNSGGGTVSLFTGAVDTRIAITMPGSYFCTFAGSIGSIEHCECNYVPGILNLGEMYDIAGLTAPRFFCAIHGEQDPIFPIGETRKAFSGLQRIYAWAGAPDNCSLYVGPEGHRYYKAGAWEFVDKHLKDCNFYPEYKMEDHLGVCCSVDDAAKVKAAGGSYVETGISSFLIPEKSESEFAGNQATALEAPLPVIRANGFFPGDLKLVGNDADLTRAVNFAENAMRRASRIGIRIFVLGSGGARKIEDGTNREEARAQFVKLCRALGPVAEKYDVTIAIEPLRRQETNFINSVREATSIAREVGHPRITVLADFYHMAQENEGPEAIVEAGDLLTHCHIAENEGRRAPGNKGDDFTPYFKALKQIGYQGCISVECVWKDFDNEVGKALDEMKKQIKTIE